MIKNFDNYMTVFQEKNKWADMGVASKTISEVLLRIYEPPDGNFFRHVLSVLEDYVPAALYGHSVYHLDSGRINKELVDSKVPVGFSRSEIDELVATHPILPHYRQNRGRLVLCTTDYISLSDWKKTRIYNELYRPFGLLYDTSVRFYDDLNCYTFTFTDSVPLSEDSLHLLDLVALHLGNAFKMVGLREKYPRDAVMLSFDGKLKHCPPGTRARLNHYYPHEKSSAIWGLPQEVECWVRTRTQYFSSSDGTPSRNKLVARRSRGMLTLSLIMLETGLMLLLEESMSVRPYDMLLTMGLTQREAEVLNWVCHGKQNSEIALILQISTATVRKHMEHILEKLNCETRGEVAQMVKQKVIEELQGVEPEPCSICTKPVCTFC